MRPIVQLAMCAALAATLMAQEPLAKGQEVVGAVATLDGGPVANAAVALQPIKPGIVVEGNLLARTEADGSFKIQNVPEGDYRACVPWSESNVLDPCVWGGFPARVSVTGKEAPQKVRVVVNQGVDLSLHIEDATRLLPSHDERKARRPALMVGVNRPGVPFLPMRLVGAVDASREYRLVVPAEVALSVTADSADFDLEEPPPAVGKPDFAAAPGSLKAELKIPRGTAKKELRLRVKGKK